MMECAQICDECMESMSLEGAFTIEWLTEAEDVERVEWIFCSATCISKYFTFRKHLGDDE